MSLSAEGVRASRNMAHMMVDQHFMNLPEAMIPVGGARVQSLADPVGDIEVRFSALFWSEVQVPAAVVVLVGHDAVLPGSCDDAWFDAHAAEVFGDQGPAFLQLGYDRVVALVDGDGLDDLRFVSVANDR